MSDQSTTDSNKPRGYGGGPLSALGMVLLVIGFVVTLAGLMLGEIAQAGGQPSTSALALLDQIAWGGIGLAVLGGVFVAIEAALAAAVLRIADRIGGLTEDDTHAE